MSPRTIVAWAYHTTHILRFSPVERLSATHATASHDARLEFLRRHEARRTEDTRDSTSDFWLNNRSYCSTVRAKRCGGGGGLECVAMEVAGSRLAEKERRVGDRAATPTESETATSLRLEVEERSH
jgi:hypothetical protein